MRRGSVARSRRRNSPPTPTTRAATLSAPPGLTEIIQGDNADLAGRLLACCALTSWARSATTRSSTPPPTPTTWSGAASEPAASSAVDDQVSGPPGGLADRRSRGRRLDRQRRGQDRRWLEEVPAGALQRHARVYRGASQRQLLFVLWWLTRTASPSVHVSSWGIT